MKRKRKIRSAVLLFLLCTILWKGNSHRPLIERACRMTDDTYQVGYLLNLDGMKGLGHAALLLIDEQGFGTLWSYNGMQYDLVQCLAGREGIGKMMKYTLEPLEVEELLRTGDLEADSCVECSNFDRMLYRRISEEEYEQITCAAEIYAETGDQYERLYAELFHAEESQRPEAEARMEQFLKRDIPRYQIYTHNCDTVARELLALADDEIRQYNRMEQRLTPKSNYKNMCTCLSDVWGIAKLGEDSLVEKLLDL